MGRLARRPSIYPHAHKNPKYPPTLRVTALWRVPSSSSSSATCRRKLPSRVGTAAGNIVEITPPTVQFGRPTYGDKDGRVTYEIPFRVIGSAYKYLIK